jgi:hypothetical protein
MGLEVTGERNDDIMDPAPKAIPATKIEPATMITLLRIRASFEKNDKLTALNSQI